MLEGCPSPCPLGKYGSTMGKTLQNDACPHTCEPGKYGSRTGQISESECAACPNGFYCSNGLKTPCPSGKYGKPLFALIEKSLESSACIDCPVARYGAVEGQAIMGSACLACPAGRYGNEPGLSNETVTGEPVRVEDYCPEACSAGEFLDGKQCKPCANGAFCPGGTDAAGMTALNGHWRVPNTTIFVQCLNPCACLGAINPSSTCPEANQHHPEGCNVQLGYRAGSRLCADCMNGYSRDERGKCKKCSDAGLKIAFPVLASVGILCCLFFLVWSTVIKRGGAFEASDGAKKIFISYLQLATLATTMDIPWPGNYLAVFRAQALVSSVGEAFIDVRCAMDEPVSIAQVEYGKTLAYALLPVGLVLLSVFIWKTCGRRFVRADKVNAMLTGTIVLLLYLIYPSIAASVLSLWKCQEVEGVGSIFIVDPETLCTDESHQVWLNGVGVPSILLYVLGLPALALGVLYKFRHKLDEANTRVRFGLLYDGFKREHYTHEFWVMMRKVSVIVIGIFMGKLQVMMAMGTVGILLVHTVIVKPFQTESLSRLEIMLLTCCFLTFWIGGVFVVHPQCQSGDTGERTICLVGEVSVLVFNLISMVVGLGTYLWFNWMESRDSLKGSSKNMCAAISRWRICQPCCKKGIGIWLRASQTEWAENPLGKELELEEFRASVLGDDELIAKQAEVIKKQAEVNKKLRDEIKKLRGLKLTITDAKRANQLRRSKTVHKIVAQLKEDDLGDMAVTNPMRK